MKPHRAMTYNELLTENYNLTCRVEQLQAELNNANGGLIASRELCRQFNATINRLESAAAYATTKRFHERQAQPTRGVSIPAAELAVTEQEDEAFRSIPGRSSVEIRLDDLEQRMQRAENAFLVQQGRINAAHDRLDFLKDAV